MEKNYFLEDIIQILKNHISILNIFNIAIISTFIFILIHFFYNFIYIYYEIERDLKNSVFFHINVIISISFILGITAIPTLMTEPIQIRNLSSISQIKYFILFIVALIFILTSITIYFFINTKSLYVMEYFNNWKLKDQMRILITGIGDATLATYCIKILTNIHDSAQFRLFFFSAHFLIFGAIRLIQAFFLLNFAYFEGDLRYNIIVLPISFVSWLLSFFDCYLNYFLLGTINYTNQIISVSSKKPISSNKQFILVTGYDLNFKFTKFGVDQGFTDIHATGNTWLRAQQINYYFSRYYKLLAFTNYIALALRVISWFIISIISIEELQFATFLNLIKRSFSCSRPLLAPTDARWVIPEYRSLVKAAVENKAAPYHPVMVDPTITNEEGHYKFEGHLTHGPGTNKHPSSTVHPTKDLERTHPDGVKAVYPKNPSYINPKHVEKEPIPNSVEFFKDDTVRENIAKNSFRNWEEENT